MPKSHMQTSKNKVLELIMYLAQMFSFLIFSYITISHILRLVQPVENYIDPKIFDINYLRFIVFLGFTLGFIGWIIAIIEKQLKLVSPIRESREENVAVALTAFFLAIFYNGLFVGTKFLQYPIFILLFLIFFFFITQLVFFYSSFKLNEFKNLLASIFHFKIQNFRIDQTLIKESFRKKNVYFIPLIILSLVTVLFSFLFVSNIITDYLGGKTFQENLNRKKFHISRIVPDKALHAQRVILEGFNFGWKNETDDRYRLMSSQGPIKLIEEWTNEKIDFTVPIELPAGKKEVWIEKPTDSNIDKSTLKSNKVTLEVYSRFVVYPEIDDNRLERVIKKIKKFLFLDVQLFNDILFTDYE